MMISQLWKLSYSNLPIFIILMRTSKLNFPFLWLRSGCSKHGRFIAFLPKKEIWICTLSCQETQATSSLRQIKVKLKLCHDDYPQIHYTTTVEILLNKPRKEVSHRSDCKWFTWGTTTKHFGALFSQVPYQC